jgi:Ca2+-binding EF-hand superfamily protein
MNTDFDQELAELEEILSVFSSDLDGSLSVNQICSVLETEDQNQEQTMEKIRESFGVHDSITFLQLSELIRERIEIVTELKKRA